MAWKIFVFLNSLEFCAHDLTEAFFAVTFIWDLEYVAPKTFITVQKHIQDILTSKKKWRRKFGSSISYSSCVVCYICPAWLNEFFIQKWGYDIV